MSGKTGFGCIGKSAYKETVRMEAKCMEDTESAGKYVAFGEWPRTDSKCKAREKRRDNSIARSLQHVIGIEPGDWLRMFHCVCI